MEIFKLDNWNLFASLNQTELEEFTKMTTYTDNQMQYNFRKKKMESVLAEVRLHPKYIDKGVQIKAGYAGWLKTNFGEHLDEKSLSVLDEFLVNPSYEEFYDDRLYPNQNEDLNLMLKTKRSVFQCYTGYGKSEVIARLIEYLINKFNYRILIVTPGSKALDEIKHRIHSKLGIELPYFDYNSNLNAIAINGFLRSSQYAKGSDYWKGVDVILADEVEYDLTDKSEELFELCTNLKLMYGFSATADKSLAKQVSPEGFRNNLYLRNNELISYFGFASVFRKPTSFDISLYCVTSPMFNNVINAKNPSRITDADDYSAIISKIYTDFNVCSGLKRIASKFTPVFIPINRLQLIDNWVQNYFNGFDENCIIISSRGYELYVGGHYERGISIEDAKSMINSNEVQYIFGTRSAFSALDFQSLKSIVSLHSALASITLQTIGRVSRGKKFNIIMIKNDKDYIPCYTGDYWKRLKLIKEYFGDSGLKIEYLKDEVSYEE